MINQIKSEKGAGAIIIAMMGVVTISIVIASLPSKITELAKDHKRLQSMIFVTSAMQDAAELVIDARVKGLDVDLNGGSCPAGHTQKSLRDTASAPLKTYCFPNDSGARCFNNPTNPAGAPLCIDLDDITSTAKNENLRFQFKPNLNFTQKAKLYVKNEIGEKAVWLSQELNWLPKAQAIPSDIPPAPSASTVTNNANIQNCALNLAAAPTNDNLCEYCSANNADCVLIQICAPGSSCLITNDYYNQRIMLFMGD